MKAIMVTWTYICMVMFITRSHASSIAYHGESSHLKLAESPTMTTSSTKGLKLLVISGAENGGWTESVELADPTGNDSSCPFVPDYPMLMSYGTAQNIGNQFIVSCGENPCYLFDMSTKEWKEYAQLAEENRGGAASVLINDHEMWITGGYDGARALETTEIIDTNAQSVRRGPDLPEPMLWHCAIKINSTHVFTANGYKAYLVNVSEEPFEFTRLPDMEEERPGAGCGFVWAQNDMSREGIGEPVVVVAGGIRSPSTSEVFHVEKNQWVEGPALPRGFKAGGSVNPNDRLFILAGGKDQDNYRRSDVFQLDAETMQFVTLPGTLKNPRSSFAMTWVMMDDNQC